MDLNQSNQSRDQSQGQGQGQSGDSGGGGHGYGGTATTCTLMYRENSGQVWSNMGTFGDLESGNKAYNDNIYASPEFYWELIMNIDNSVVHLYNPPSSLVDNTNPDIHKENSNSSFTAVIVVVIIVVILGLLFMKK